MSLKNDLNQDLIVSMKAKDSFKVKTLRSLTAAIKQIEIDTRKDISEEQILSLLQKQIKQRKESLSIYEDNNRQDLANTEQQELNILEQYLPSQMNESELDALVQETIKNLEAASMKDMGKVMNSLKPKISGKADPSIVSSLVKKYLV